MAKREALGRGLDALLPEPTDEELFYHTQKEEDGQSKEVASAENAEEEKAEPVRVESKKSKLPKGISVDESGTLWVDPALLKPNPYQPREYFDQEKLEELTASIKEVGVLSPPIIEDAGDGSFYIIMGERRTRAARAAGLKKMPVILRKYSDIDKLILAIVENIHRADLNPVEEAKAYEGLIKKGLTQEDVAKKVTKSRSAVANSLRLLKLPEDMQQALAAGNLTAGHARTLLSVVNPADQRVLFGRIMGQGLSVRECERQAVELNGGSKVTPNTKKDNGIDTRDPNYIAIENQFRDAFGTKVSMKGDFEKGSITIEYFNKADLDRIFNVIIH